MQRIEKIEKEEWNTFVTANAEDGGVLQSWEWGELEKAEGNQVWRLAFEDCGELAACCLLIERRLSFGWKYLYAPRGPIVSQNHKITKSQNQIFIELEKFAREQGAIFLRIEPPYTNNLQLTCLPDRQATYNLQTVQPVQPKETLRIDLTQSEEQLLAGMRQKTRYNIGLAEKRGVSVSAHTKSDLPSEVGLRHIDIFFDLLQTTTTRDDFRMHPREHYETILSMLDAKLFFASYHGQPIATALVVFFGRTAYYLHGASANEHRDVMAPYALHSEIMREAKRRGCTTYDLWGVDAKRWPGVTRFKKGFAPDQHPMQYAGTYDLPLSSLRYQLYRARHFFS